MADARSMKLKEYGTNLISHDPSINNDGGRVRVNNTFKSSVMDQTPDLNLNKAKSRDRIFQQKPLTAQVTRTSYQDSNIFGYKDQGSETVQPTAQQDSKQERVRYNPTYQSRVFPGAEDNNVVEERAGSSTRNEANWKSTVFEGPVIDPPNRKKLGRKDAGTENLFGSHTVDYDNKSNKMNILAQKKPQKKWEPVRKTAEQRKNEELYGRSAAIYGTGKKGDGSLMANSADWRNLQQTHTNQPIKEGFKNGANDGAAKDRKYQNLQSNILANEESTGDKPLYDKNFEKAAFGTASDWTVQGGQAKVINKGLKVDTFQKRKAQLQSQVFDLPDYQEHVPMKKKTLDVNNVTDNKRRQDHMYSDILGQSGLDYKVKSPVRVNDEEQSQGPKQTQPLNSKDARQNNLRSSLDTYNYEEMAQRIPQEAQETPEKLEYSIPGKKDRVTKVKELASNILGQDTASKFSQVNNEYKVVDLDLKGLPAEIQPEDLKKISGVKHVINATVDQDSIRNICTGTGRIKMRISANEDLDSVKLQYVKAGFTVLDHAENPKKKTTFTSEVTLATRSPQRSATDAKLSKMGNLQSNNPEIFGNSSQHQKKHNIHFDASEVNKDKVNQVSESLAIDSWSKVGGKR